MIAPRYVDTNLGMSKYRAKCDNIHKEKLEKIKKREVKVLSSFDHLYRKIDEQKAKSHHYYSLKREDEIQRKNKFLLNKLTEISFGKWSSVPAHTQKHPKRSLNFINRNEQHKIIERQNLDFAQRLLSKKPNLSKANLDQAYQNHCNYRGNLEKLKKPQHQGRVGHLAPIKDGISIKTDEENYAKLEKKEGSHLSLGKRSPRNEGSVRHKKKTDHKVYGGLTPKERSKNAKKEMKKSKKLQSKSEIIEKNAIKEEALEAKSPVEEAEKEKEEEEEELKTPEKPKPQIRDKTPPKTESKAQEKSTTPNEDRKTPQEEKGISDEKTPTPAEKATTPVEKTPTPAEKTPSVTPVPDPQLQHKSDDNPDVPADLTPGKEETQNIIKNIQQQHQTP